MVVRPERTQPPSEMDMRFRVIASGVMVTGLLAATGPPAQAAVMRGTDGPDTLVGTPRPDGISGRGGDDLLFGKRGADGVSGQAGDDTLHLGRSGSASAGEESGDGGRGDDHVYGGRGFEFIWGRGGDDHLYGGPGDEQVEGGFGNDYIDAGPGANLGPGFENFGGSFHGGGGRDVIIGRDARDVINPGRGADTVNSGAGDDRIFVQVDGRPDVIDCGDGTDEVLWTGQDEVADPADVLTGCENVGPDSG